MIAKSGPKESGIKRRMDSRKRYSNDSEFGIVKFGPEKTKITSSVNTKISLGKPRALTHSRSNLVIKEK